MPRLGKTGLYYCGRKVMENHNFPDNDLTDGICGPESGPNCPACRVLKTDKMDLLNKNGKFQGYSGMIYCGKNCNKKSKGHDGLCGPDNGPPCDECLNEILNEVDDSQKRSEIICSKIDGPFVDSEDKNLKNEESKREEHKIKKAKSDELKSEELKFKECEVIHEDDLLVKEQEKIEQDLLNLIRRQSTFQFTDEKLNTSISIKKFCQRQNDHACIIEKENMAICYYMGQSCHEEVKSYHTSYKVKVWIDQKLDDDWTQNIKEALSIIKRFTPGLNIKCETVETFFGIKESNSVFILSNDGNKAFIEGSIFSDKLCKISISNSWISNRQGIALHQILHSLGFNHELSRNKKVNNLKTYKQEDNNFSIFRFSKELTPHDPYSALFYKESKEIEVELNCRTCELNEDIEQTNNFIMFYI